MTICTKKIPLSFLCCGLYTLFHYNKAFKSVHLKSDILLNFYSDDYFAKDFEKFSEFYELLNNSSLKIFAKQLLKSLKYNDCFEFKKYLSKFTSNYRIYFFFQNGNYKNFPTIKEINSNAIMFLFLISSVRY